MPRKKSTEQMDSVFRACKWFNFASVLFAYVLLLTYAFLWLFSSVKCTYDFPALEAWNCSFWNFAIYLFWWPVVYMYLVRIEESTLADARWNGGLYPHVSRMSILHCVFVVAYTILYWVHMLKNASRIVALTAPEHWKTEKVQVMALMMGILVVMTCVCGLVILLAAKRVRDVMKAGIKDYEDDMVGKCEMGEMVASGVEGEGKSMADEAGRRRSDEEAVRVMDSSEEGTL